MYLAQLSGLDKPEAEAKGALERVGLPETWNVACGALSQSAVLVAVTGFINTYCGGAGMTVLGIAAYLWTDR